LLRRFAPRNDEKAATLNVGDTAMAMDAHDIEAMIKAALPDAIVEIKDLAGDGDHYAATVTSSAFAGKSRVQQHQMVYAALKGNMGGVLHALALTTSVPQN
jgi:stress-induced morphogen